MIIKNIDDLKKNINRSTATIFFIIFSFVSTGLYFAHSKFKQKQLLIDQQKLIFAQNLFKSNLSEKLSIIASSTDFLDYLHSGTKTRNKLYPRILSQLYSLTSKSIVGTQLIDSHNQIIFNDGNSSSIYVSLKLCYLNQTLDPIMGNCHFSWKLYFDSKKLLRSIQSINQDIQPCLACTSYDFFNGKSFGSFTIKSSSGYHIKLSAENSKDYFFYVYLSLMTGALILFGIWNWYKLSNVLNKYIANPIKFITHSLKTNHLVHYKDNIEEIRYLIHEINGWKSQLSKAKADENAAKIGRITAQVAHDVRSPLAVINMAIKKLSNIPEDYKTIIYSAIQRMSDIANNLLIQYKNPLESQSDHIKKEHIPSILKNILSEKQSQYANKDVSFELLIDDNVRDVSAQVHANDLKRVLSNLMNNAVESISQNGKVVIKLSKLKDFLKIEIIDNGCGIPSDVFPKVIKGGVSIGKINGSGLGISHAIKCVNHWDGKIDIQSCVTEGTRVNILLPSSGT